MYRRPKFLEVLLEIRREMAREADYDVDLFAEIARSGERETNATNQQLYTVDEDSHPENSEPIRLGTSSGA